MWTHILIEKKRKETILRGIGENLAGFEEIELGYVHGSFLEKDFFRDIDVAILLSEKFSGSYEKFKFAMRVGRDIEKAIQPRFEVDVKVLNPSPIAFQFQVIRKGRLVYARTDVDRIRYEANVLSEYQDYKPVLDWFKEKYLAKQGNGQLLKRNKG